MSRIDRVGSPSAPLPDRSAIDRAEVARIAHLSRLDLDDPALDAATAHLQSMLEFVAMLDTVDRPEVSARVHGGEGGEPVLRPDVIGEPLSSAEALAGAPDKGPEGFRVPAVIGDST